VIERDLFLILSAKPVPDIVFLLCDHQPHAENYLLESLIPLRALASAAAPRDLGITDLREQNMLSVRTLSASFVAVALSMATASAEKWPARPIKVISPFTAGNAGDTVARIVFDQVSQQIGQTLFIENRPGAGGTLAADFVAKSDPDGYTLLLSSASLSSQVIFHKTLPYDAIRAFAPVSLIGLQPTVVVASPSRAFKTLADLVAAAKAKPGTLTFASAGVGSASHMAAERLRVAAAIDARHIPFRGAEGLNEVMAGRVDFYCIPVAPAVPLINAGKVTVLAVSTRKRAALLPNVPTVAEAGYPDAEYLYWGGVAAPAKTPTTVVHKLHDEIEKALQLPPVREKLATLGVEEQLLTVEQFDKFVSDDMAATLSLAKSAHLEPED
jgi:tripartite-type tricarboxylate transporter receptor subunit TctC